MKKNTIVNRILPYVVALLVFLGITLAYFSPLLQGEVLDQHDIRVFKASAKEVIDFREETGTEALWTNSMFSGMPAYQISVQYKNNLFTYIDKVLRLNLPRPADYVFLYFAGFFLLLLCMGVNPWISLIGAIGYALSSYFLIILGAGHNTKAHAIAYIAPVLAGMVLTFKKRYLIGAAITGLFLALEIKAGHPQITYYLLLIVLLFGVSQLIHIWRVREWNHLFKSVGILIIVCGLAVGTHASMLLTTMEYSKASIRGKTELSTEKENRTSGLDLDYATQWSYGIDETLTLLIPDVMGGGSQRTPGIDSKTYETLIQQGVPKSDAKSIANSVSLYFGDQPGTSGPVYIGAIIFFLFVLGLFVVKGPIKWWLLASTILSILLAWGHNFMWFTEFFMHYVPGYNKFRAVSMTLVIAELAMPLLGILALNEILTGDKSRKEKLRLLKWPTIIVGGVTLLIALVPSILFNFEAASDAYYLNNGFPQWLIDAVREDRADLTRSDAFRSLIFVLLAAGVIWASVSKKLKINYAILILGVLILCDIWVVDKRYMNDDNFTSKRNMNQAFPTTVADKEILKDNDPNFRVLNLTVDPFNDASTSLHHKSIGGYHGAKLRRYQEVIEHHISKNNMSVLNMLNTKYFIQSGADRIPKAIQNREALGNAWFVSDTTLVHNADDELAALTYFNPKMTAVIDARFSDLLSSFEPANIGSAEISLTSYKPNELVYEYQSDKPRLVVFSEIFYDKGWNAYIGGELQPHFRANYLLRALMLPAGEKEVVFKFEPKSYRIGEVISLISSLLLIAFSLFVIFITWRRQKEK